MSSKVKLYFVKVLWEKLPTDKSAPVYRYRLAAESIDQVFQYIDGLDYSQTRRIALYHVEEIG